MKKILVILTGGTIGSCDNNGVISADNNKVRALELYKKKYSGEMSEYDFECVSVLNILSENLNKRHWEIIVNYLLSCDMDRYCGVIVTHGSDTLSYSSAMLSMCLCTLPVPIIITAADRVPDDPDSNALCNLRACVVMINSLQRGVFTVYRNSGDDFCSVFLPARLQEADRVFGRFSSFDGMSFGTVRNDSFIQNNKDISLYDIYNKNTDILHGKKLELKNDVLVVRPYPSMDYSCIVPSENTKAVLHITYHSSTACTSAENSALSFLERCNGIGIPMYLASFPKSADRIYETADTLIKHGAVPLESICNEAAFAKLLLYFNLLFSERFDINDDICFELF